MLRRILYILAVALLVFLAVSVFYSFWTCCSTSEQHQYEGYYQDCIIYAVLFNPAVYLLSKIFSVETFAIFISAIATIFIARFTQSLRQSTDKLWRETRAAADAANTTAKVAQRQFAAGFKPWLIVEVSGPYVDERKRSLNKPPEGERTYVSIYAIIKVTNRTDMPAVITESNVRVENQSLGLGGPRPEIGLYEIIGKSESFYPLRRHPLIEPDNVNLGSFFMTAKNRDMFFSEKPPIIGRIEYEDSIGNRYEFGFAFQPASVWGHPINATNRFIRWGGAQYNFDRPIEATPKSER